MTADTSGLTEPEQTTTTEIGSTAPSSSANINNQQAIQAEPNQYQAPGPDPAPPVTTGPLPTSPPPILTTTTTTSPPPTPSSVAVDISGFTFVDAAVRVRVGGTVTWTNRDTAQHSATGTGFNTGLLSLGQSASVTFNTPGTYQYQCSPHSSIRGTVIVEPSPLRWQGCIRQSCPPATTRELTGPSGYGRAKQLVLPVEFLGEDRHVLQDGVEKNRRVVDRIFRKHIWLSRQKIHL